MHRELEDEARWIRENYPELTHEETLRLVNAGLAMDYANLKEHLELEGMLPDSVDEAAHGLVTVISGLSSLSVERQNALKVRLFSQLTMDEWLNNRHAEDAVDHNQVLPEEDYVHDQSLPHERDVATPHAHSVIAPELTRTLFQIRARYPGLDQADMLRLVTASVAVSNAQAQDGRIRANLDAADAAARQMEQTINGIQPTKLAKHERATLMLDLFLAADTFPEARARLQERENEQGQSR